MRASCTSGSAYLGSRSRCRMPLKCLSMPCCPVRSTRWQRGIRSCSSWQGSNCGVCTQPRTVSLVSSAWVRLMERLENGIQDLIGVECKSGTKAVTYDFQSHFRLSLLLNTSHRAWSTVLRRSFYDRHETIDRTVD
jgi:hypothetical protein